MSLPQPDVNMDLYTRNGFVGPAAFLIRSQYAPEFTRVVGSYTPQRFSIRDVPDEAFVDPRSHAVPLITGEGISIETARRTEDMQFAVRNVNGDELHFIYSGSARLETDFGALDIVAGDFVLIPRAVTYRFRAVTGELLEAILVTPSELNVETRNPAEVFDVANHVDVPDPSATVPVEVDGEYEIVIRHGRESTSYFFATDPLLTLQADGAPIVRRFNIQNLHTISDHGAAASPPPRIIDDASTRTLVFHIGTRETGRPPIHHNADYDEIAFYVAGPGHWGAMREPGTVVWVPKGVIHQGPTENVPDGFMAFLIEVRAPLAYTPIGREIGNLTETNLFDVHHSVVSSA